MKREGNDDNGGEEDVFEELVDESEGAGGGDSDIDEAEDEAGNSGGDEGTTEMGGVGGEGVRLLEGEGSGEDDGGEDVEDNPEVDDISECEDDDGEDDGKDGKEVGWAEGAVGDDDLEEAVEKEETKGRNERNQEGVEHVAELDGEEVDEVGFVSENIEKGGCEETTEGWEEEFWGFEGLGRVRGMGRFLVVGVFGV